MTDARWPKHLGTKRDFMRRKRKEFRQLALAVKAFSFGCAYLPPLPTRDLALRLEAIEDLGQHYRAWWRHA